MYLLRQIVCVIVLLLFFVAKMNGKIETAWYVRAKPVIVTIENYTGGAREHILIRCNKRYALI